MTLAPTPPVSRLSTIQQRIIDTAALPKNASRSLPREAFVDPVYYDFEVDNILKKEWLSVAHVSQIPKAGDYLNLDLFGEPITVVRGKDMVVRVLSRVCTHRGMDVMPKEYGHPERGNARVFLCPYHFWGYDLDGQLKGAPEMNKNECFSRKDFCLHNYRSEIFEGFIFVTFNPDAPPLSELFATLKTHLAPWNMGDLQMVTEMNWDCHFNWKVLVENFMEYYHHLGAHVKTLEPFLPARGCYTEPEQHAFSMAHLPLAPDLAEKIKAGTFTTPFPRIPSMTQTHDLHWYIFCGYPTFLLFTAPDRVYWYRLIPTGVDTMQLLTTALVLPSALEQPGFQETLEVENKLMRDFHVEDMEMCDAVQKGMRSSTHRQAPLSHLEEPIWNIQRYLSRKIREAQSHGV